MNDKILINALQTISFLREMNDDAIDILKMKLTKKEELIKKIQNDHDKLKNKNNELEIDNKVLICRLEQQNIKLSKKDDLNKRLINILTIYKYHELNNVQKYNYNEIKQKNKQLNQEFKRIYKLISKNIGYNLINN